MLIQEFTLYPEHEEDHVIAKQPYAGSTDSKQFVESAIALELLDTGLKSDEGKLLSILNTVDSDDIQNMEISRDDESSGDESDDTSDIFENASIYLRFDDTDPILTSSAPDGSLQTLMTKWHYCNDVKNIPNWSESWLIDYLEQLVCKNHQKCEESYISFSGIEKF